MEVQDIAANFRSVTERRYQHGLTNGPADVVLTHPATGRDITPTDCETCFKAVVAFPDRLPFPGNLSIPGVPKKCTTFVSLIVSIRFCATCSNIHQKIAKSMEIY